MILENGYIFRGFNSTLKVFLITANIELSYRVRPLRSPLRSPRPRVERQVQIQSDYFPTANTQQNTKHCTLRTENGKTLHHMAQSRRSPIGVKLFGESGANPPTEWQTWIATFKLAVMAQHNLEVDKLLRLKPARTDLFYPTMPTLEEKFEKQTTRHASVNNAMRKDVWTGKMNAR